jgi:hypothetical protein
MQVKVFVGSKIWISRILLLPLLEIWDVTLIFRDGSWGTKDHAQQ